MRINRYEKTVHDADLATAPSPPSPLGFPLAFLDVETDDTKGAAALTRVVLSKSEQCRAMVGLKVGLTQSVVGSEQPRPSPDPRGSALPFDALMPPKQGRGLILRNSWRLFPNPPSASHIVPSRIGSLRLFERSRSGLDRADQYRDLVLRKTWGKSAFRMHLRYG